MARYIDAEVLRRKLIDDKNFFPAILARALEETPTVEVEELVLKAKSEVLAEVELHMTLYQGPDNLRLVIDGNEFTELKKKYTEETT